MRNIDLIHTVTRAAADRWPDVLANLGIDVPNSPRIHAPCPACFGTDRFRFDDNGRGAHICNQCGAGDGLDLVKKVLNIDTYGAAKAIAEVLGIDCRTYEATSQTRELSEAERESRRQAQSESKANEQAKKRERFTARYRTLDATVTKGTSDYLTNKGLTGFTLPLLPDGNLLIPLVDANGAVTGAQTITPAGEKRLLTDSTKKGSYYLVNAPETVSTVILAEGLATALSVHLMRPDALTVAAIDAGNLLPVAKVMRSRYPEATIILAGDNDIKLNEPNTGKDAAEKAALSVAGWVALPPTNGQADWDDYRQENGLEAAAGMFNELLYQVEGGKLMSAVEVIATHSGQKKNSEDLKPYLETRPEGLFWIKPDIVKGSSEVVNIEQWLSDPMKPAAKGVNDIGEHYLIIEYGKGEIKALPSGSVGDREGWRILRSAGVNVTAKPAMQNILADWLNTRRHLTKWLVTHKSGWHKGAYIMPDGSIIGTPEQPILFNGQSAAATAYQTKGTLDSWRDDVAALADGNPFMMFSIGAALAAPMAGITLADSFGIHLYAQSTAGKSTTADMAVSLYGDPDLQRLTWYGTAYGIANEAVAHNDGLLYLDEVGQGADPKHVYKSAYTLFNGKGKIQGARDGGNRPLESWRTVAISTGEKDIETFLLSAGMKVNAGQLVRLLNIPIVRATELHGHETGKGHADAIRYGCRDNYGAAGRYWIEYLANHKDAAREAYATATRRWAKLIPSSYGEQVQRASDRFAAIEAALLAGRIVTGWSEQDCIDTVQTVFNVWVKEFGTGNKEIQQIVEQAEGFLTASGFSRYLPYPNTDERDLPIRELAGYRTGSIRNEGEIFKFYTFPHVFEKEIATGFNPQHFAKALSAAGMLEAGGDRLKKKGLKKIGGKQHTFYVLMYSPEEEESQPE